MVNILSCPLEVLELIVNGLERCQLVNDNSGKRWPMYSEASTQDIRNVRLTHSTLRDAAWPALGRVLGSSIFSITPISLKTLMTIAEHKQLHNKVTTLKLSDAFIQIPSDNPTSSPAYFYRTNNGNCLPYREEEMEAKELEELNQDRVTLDKAWHAAAIHHVNFCAANHHETLLTTIFKKLTNLRNLRTTWRWHREVQTEDHRLWLRLELGDKLAEEDRHLLDRCDVRTNHGIDHKNHMHESVKRAIVDSGVRFQSIIGLYDDVYFLEVAQTLACLTALRKTSALQNLSAFTWKPYTEERDGLPLRQSSFGADVLATLFNAAPRLRRLHLSLWESDIEGWFDKVKQPLALELLDIDHVCLTREALMAFISPSLKNLRLSSVELCTPHPYVEDITFIPAAAWSGVLADIVGISNLQMLELDHVGCRVDLVLPYTKLQDIAAKVAFVANGDCAWHPPPTAIPPTGPRQLATVFVDGVEIDDGPNTHPTPNSKMGLWKGARFGLPLNMKHYEDEETGRVVYEETDRLVGVV